MRLFVAIPVVEPAHSEVAGLLAHLRENGWPVRWVREEGIHLTLKFFGEVAPERFDVIEEAVRIAGRGTDPLPLRLAGLGGFPTDTRPRVLWVGIEAPPALELLQDRLERGGEAIGFPPEGVPFQPHITLGRVREGHRIPVADIERLGGRLQPTPFLATELVLYESVLTPRGPRYESRLTIRLGA